MPKYPTENVTLRNLEVLRTPFRNFTGVPTKFNPDGGKRFFNIRLDEKTADKLRAAGWNVKELKPLQEGAEPLWIMEIKVKFGDRPPKVVKVTPSGKTPLTEDVVDALDGADIDFADVIFRPYQWDPNETPSAYLQTGFFNIKLDELEMQYDMDGEDGVICDDDGVCYLNGVKIN